MSLHQLANSLQKAGRGEDKVLVHMTPKEVNGLQQLAMSRGGSLTINPETGLVEAGFLSSMLPMLAGAAAMFVPGLQGLGAGWIGAGIGGLTAISTGSLQKGLMAGLGAYGGAGLAGSLIGAGATTAAGAGSAGLGAAGANTAAAPVANTAAGANVFNTAAPVVNTAAPVAANAANAANAVTTSGFGAGANPNFMAQQFAPNVAGQSGQLLTNAAAPVSQVNAAQTFRGLGNTNVDAMASQYAQQAQALPAGSMQSTPMLSDWEKAQAGFKNVTSSGKNAWQFVKDNPGPFLGAGTALAQAMQKKYNPPEQNLGMIRPYDYTYGKTEADITPYSGSGERMYFNPVYTAKTPYKAPGPEYAADGGLMALNYAVGGSVEQMSADNAVSGNEMYPQSQLQAPMYSNPMVQRPMPSNVISGGMDTPVNAYTGETRFAEGGETTGEYKYAYNPQNQQFTQMSAPKPVDTGFRGLFGGIGNAGMTGAPMGNGPIARVVRSVQGQAAPAAAPIVTGGIAPPVGQTQQMQSYEPLQQPTVMPAYQTPEQQLGLGGFYEYMNQQLGQGYAAGGMTEGHLGGYSDGGRLLKGPGDGVSDSIPAVIGNRQPARLADGEFVVNARTVSELGNGSTEAGARKLYAMMDRVQHARKKSIGKNKVAVDSKADRFLPA